MPRRALALITMATLVAATATGCQGSDEAATTPGAEPRYTAIEVPDAMAPSEVTVHQVGLLGAADGTPWSVHAVRTEPGKQPRAVVWTSDGGVLPAEPTELPVDGAVESLVVAGSGELIVAAVRVSVAGVDSTQVLTSTDRRTWAPVAATDPGGDDPAGTDVAGSDLSGVDVAAATVAGDEAVLVGTDRATGDPAGFGVTADGVAETFGMPKPAGGADARLHLKAVAWQAGELAVVASQDRGGVAEDVSVYRSIDRGRTWVEDRVEGDHVQVAGFVATAHGYVLTGHVRATEEGRALTRTAVWTARTFRRGFAPVAEPPTGGLTDDAWIGAPAPSGEGYRVLIAGPHSAEVALTAEDGTILAMSDPLEERGLLGPTAVDADGTPRMIAAGRHGATVLEVRPDESGGRRLVPVATLAAAQRWFTPYGPGGPGVLAAGSSQVVDWDEGWRSFTLQHRYVLDGTGSRLVDAPSGGVADEAEGWRIDVAGPAGDVALVLGPEPGNVGNARSVPWARPTGGEWQRGVLPGPTPQAGRPVWVAGEWLLPGTTAPSTDIDDVETAALWSSPDGLSWAAADGFPGALGEEADTVCPLGSEDALVLGSHQGTPLVWARLAGSWQTLPVTAEGRRVPYDCYVAADGRTVIRFAEGDGTRLVATADGAATQEVLATGDDAWIGTVRTIDGGYAAAGWARDADGQARAVVWVSTDGLDWRRLDGPAGEGGLSDLVVLDGTVLVMSDDDQGTHLWRVDDLALAMSAVSAKMDS